MALQLKDGSQFLHIPKTGGSWVSEVLHEQGLVAGYVGHKHADYDLTLFNERIISGTVVPVVLREGWNRIQAAITGNRKPERHRFRFAFVRHPLAWYESHWLFTQSLDWVDWGEPNTCFRWHPCSALNGLGSTDFNEFVSNVIRVRPGYVSELYFASTKRGIDFIGKNETLRDDFKTVADLRGWLIDSALVEKKPAANVSDKGAARPQWDPKLRDLVMRLEMPALVHFDYLDHEERRWYGIPDDLLPHPALRATSQVPLPAFYPKGRRMVA